MYNDHQARTQNRIVPRVRGGAGSFQQYKEQYKHKQINDAQPRVRFQDNYLRDTMRDTGKDTMTLYQKKPTHYSGGNRQFEFQKEDGGIYGKYNRRGDNKDIMYPPNSGRKDQYESQYRKSYLNERRSSFGGNIGNMQSNYQSLKEQYQKKSAREVCCEYERTEEEGRSYREDRNYDFGRKSYDRKIEKYAPENYRTHKKDDNNYENQYNYKKKSSYEDHVTKSYQHSPIYPKNTPELYEMGESAKPPSSKYTINIDNLPINPQFDLQTPKNNREREDCGNSVERRKSLIQKSKNLKDKLNKLTQNTPKKVLVRENYEQDGLNPRQRIEKLRTGKDRFYDSPFKQQAENHEFYQNKQREDKYYNKSSSSFKKISNTLTQKQSGFESKVQKMNFQSNYDQKQEKENRNDCMGRISMLNNKINERINSIIQSFGGDKPVNRGTGIL